MSDVTTLGDFAEQYLEVCIEALGTTAGGAITPAFISPSAPAFDCPDMLVIDIRQLELDLTRIGENAPAQRHRVGSGLAVPLVTLGASVVRCQPQPDVQNLQNVDPSLIQAAALLGHQDVWAIWNMVSSRFRAGLLWSGPCKSMSIGPAVPIQPSGASAGWYIPVVLWVDGYDPDA